MQSGQSGHVSPAFNCKLRAVLSSQRALAAASGLSYRHHTAHVHTGGTHMLGSRRRRSDAGRRPAGPASATVNSPSSEHTPSASAAAAEKGHKDIRVVLLASCSEREGVQSTAQAQDHRPVLKSMHHDAPRRTSSWGKHQSSSKSQKHDTWPVCPSTRGVRVERIGPRELTERSCLCREALSLSFQSFKLRESFKLRRSHCGSLAPPSTANRFDAGHGLQQRC